ncbi:MAG TPA: inositol monophosphatase family protein [Bryobacteraceae bacterium]|nr:inositol monophosphatase family protein [Bryobacteraceae bacterium]
MEPDLSKLLDLALEAASAAATVHRRAAPGRTLSAEKGSPMNLVTDVDREAERQLVSTISRARPDDAIVGEEGSFISGRSGVCWILDPLDGTTNFVHGYMNHSVAVGVEIEGKRSLGVVCDTYHDRVYSGVVGRGAHCDGEPIHAGSATALAQALIGTGFLPIPEVRIRQAEALRHILPRVRDLRRSGCPSLDLCAVAAGMLDGFYEAGLGRWDIAAGAAIVEAAGAQVLALDSLILPNPLLVAANPILMQELVNALRQAGAW